MKTRRTSYAFLMEMLWVCAFFLISACIFVLVFAKSERISRDAETLNHAVQAAANAMEDTFALYEGNAALGQDATSGSDPSLSGSGMSDSSLDAPGLSNSGLSGAVLDLAASYSGEDYFMEIDHTVEGSFLSVTVRILDSRDHSGIYTLEGDRYLAGTAAQSMPKEGIAP